MRVDGVLSKTKAHYNQLKNQGTLLRESRVNYNTHNTLLRNFGYLLLLLLLLLLILLLLFSILETNIQEREVGFLIRKHTTNFTQNP